MALSNWDTLAFGPDGASSDGNFAQEKEPDIVLRIYKNWVYVEHPRMWVAGGQYVEPTIASISHGEISLASFRIEAARDDDQQSIFVWAQEVLIEPAYRQRFFAGIGCYGFGDGGKWLGVTPRTLESFWTWMETHLASEGEDSDYAAWLKTCRAAKPARFNQGDRYFAENLGTPLSATEPGKAEEPVLMQAFAEKKEDKP